MVTKRKIISLLLACSLALSGCSQIEKLTSNKDKEEKNINSVGLVLDLGGKEDKSFNQESLKAIPQINTKINGEVRVLESNSESKIVGNIEKLAEEEYRLVFGVGFNTSQSLWDAAEKFEKSNFVSLYSAYDASSMPNNLTGVNFRNQETAFLAGYISALTTKVNRVAFIGGKSGYISDQYEYGYRSGVSFASKELKRKIEVDTAYIDSFKDKGKAKNEASKLYEKVDIIYTFSGLGNLGVIEAANENDKFVIVSETDQTYLAPKNVLTCTLNNYDKVMKDIVNKFLGGEKIGGNNYSYGFAQGAMSLSPYLEKKSTLSRDIYNKSQKLIDRIKDEKIDIADNKEDYLIKYGK